MVPPKSWYCWLVMVVVGAAQEADLKFGQKECIGDDDDDDDDLTYLTEPSPFLFFRTHGTGPDLVIESSLSTHQHCIIEMKPATIHGPVTARVSLH